MPPTAICGCRPLPHRRWRMCRKLSAAMWRLFPSATSKGHYLLMVDEDARLQWPRPVVNEVASFLACTKIFGTVVLTSAYGPELGLPDDIAHVLGDVIMATLPGRCRWEGEA